MIAWLLMGLGAVAMIATGVASCEHKGKLAAKAQTEAVQAKFDGFVIEAKNKGDEQDRKSLEKEKENHAIFLKTVSTLKGTLARRDADLLRLRSSAPTRPDSSEVPLVSCGPKAPDGTSSEQLFIAEAEFRALETRAYDDATKLTLLQAWVRRVGHPEE
jgi:hypothetical protein